VVNRCLSTLGQKRFILHVCHVFVNSLGEFTVVLTFVLSILSVLAMATRCVKLHLHLKSRMLYGTCLKSFKTSFVAFHQRQARPDVSQVPYDRPILHLYVLNVCISVACCRPMNLNGDDDDDIDDGVTSVCWLKLYLSDWASKQEKNSRIFFTSLNSLTSSSHYT